MQYVLLRNVSLASQNWTVCARAVQFCDLVSDSEPPKRLKTDLILLDEEGNTMECYVPDYWYNHTKTELLEDHIYRIKYFQVLVGKKNYRVADHDCMAKFTYHTQIEEARNVPNNFPLYAHRAASFDVLRTRINKDTVTSDAVGIITECSHARDQNTQRSGVKRLRNLTITDGIESINIALWGKHADSFDAEMCMEAARDKPVVVLFCAMTCRTYNNNLALHSSALCRWYINPEIEEANQLRQRYSEHGSALTWMHTPHRAANSETKTVTELAKLNPHVIDDKRYIVIVKIKELVPDQAWWYLACNKCNKSIREVGDTMQCKDQECKSIAGTARYRLSVICVDPDCVVPDNDENQIHLVFFGPMAQEIVGVPVHDLIDSGGGTGSFLPTKIKEIFGKVVTAQISIGNFSFGTEKVSFQVRSILGIQTTSAAIAIGQPNTPQTCSKQGQEQDASGPTEIKAKQATGAEPRDEVRAACSNTPNTTTPVPVERKRKSLEDDGEENPDETRKEKEVRRKLDVDVTPDKPISFQNENAE